jgi:hypothetical protein
VKIEIKPFCPVEVSNKVKEGFNIYTSEYPLLIQGNQISRTNFSYPNDIFGICRPDDYFTTNDGRFFINPSFYQDFFEKLQAALDKQFLTQFQKFHEENGINTFIDNDLLKSLDIQSADDLNLTSNENRILNSILSINNLSSKDLVENRATLIKNFFSNCNKKADKIKENLKKTQQESLELEEEEELFLEKKEELELEKQLDREVILAEFTAKQKKLLEKYTSLSKKLNQIINKTAFIVEMGQQDYRNIKNEHWRFIYKNTICSQNSEQILNNEKGFSLIEPFDPSIIAGKIVLISMETALEKFNSKKIQKIGSFILKHILKSKHVLNAINIAILKMPFSNLIETYSMPVAYMVAYSVICKGFSFMTPVSLCENETVFTEFEKVINLEIDNQAMKVDESVVQKVDESVVQKVEQLNSNEILIKELIKKKGKIPLTREEVEGFSAIIWFPKNAKDAVVITQKINGICQKIIDIFSYLTDKASFIIMGGVQPETHPINLGGLEDAIYGEGLDENTAKEMFIAGRREAGWALPSELEELNDRFQSKAKSNCSNLPELEQPIKQNHKVYWKNNPDGGFSATIYNTKPHGPLPLRCFYPKNYREDFSLQSERGSWFFSSFFVWFFKLFNLV